MLLETMVSNLEKGIFQNQTPTEETVRAACSPSKLVKLGKKVTEEDLDIRLLTALKQQGVGTFKIECEALKMHKESRKGEKQEKFNSKWDEIWGGRDARKVLDLLSLKIGYAQQRRKELRKEYLEEKQRLEEGLTEEGRTTKYRRIIQRVSKMARSRWA